MALGGPCPCRLGEIHSVAVGLLGAGLEICMLCRGNLAQISRLPLGIGSIRGSVLPRQQSRGASHTCGPRECWMRMALSTLLGERTLKLASGRSRRLIPLPTRLASLISRRQVLLVRANSTRLLASAFQPSSSLPFSSHPFLLSCVHSFIRSINQAKQSASSAALATQTMSWQACAAVRWI